MTPDEIVILNERFERELEQRKFTRKYWFRDENGKKTFEQEEASSLIYHLRQGNTHLIDQRTAGLIADALLQLEPLVRSDGNEPRDDTEFFVDKVLYPEYIRLELEGITGYKRLKRLAKIVWQQGFGRDRDSFEPAKLKKTIERMLADKRKRLQAEADLHSEIESATELPS